MRRMNHNDKKKKPILLWLIPAVVLAAVLTVVLLTGQDRTMEIQTPYLAVEFPEKYAEHLKHGEVEENGALVEKFSMMDGREEIELFSICFGDADRGVLEGYLHTQDGAVPVTVLVAGNSEAITDDELRNRYIAMMDALNVALDSIRRDERFREDDVQTQPQQQTTLKYWSVALPPEITCRETEEDGVYQAVFETVLDSRMVTLFTVWMGDAGMDAPLGTYDDRPVHIQTGGEVLDGSLSDEAQEQVFALMDSVNTVLDAITGDERFTAWSEE